MDRKESDRILAKGVKDLFWIELKERLEFQVGQVDKAFYTLINSEGINGYWHKRGQQEGLRKALDIVNSAHKKIVKNDQSPSSEEKG